MLYLLIVIVCSLLYKVYMLRFVTFHLYSFLLTNICPQCFILNFEIFNHGHYMLLDNNTPNHSLIVIMLWFYLYFLFSNRQLSPYSLNQQIAAKLSFSIFLLSHSTIHIQYYISFSIFCLSLQKALNYLFFAHYFSFLFLFSCKTFVISSILSSATIILIVPFAKMCKQVLMKKCIWMAGFHLH